MITYKLIHDEDMINEVFHTPNNIPWLFEDTYTGSIRIKYNPTHLYLACFLDGEYIGLVMGVPVNNEEIYLHLAFFPSAYGKVKKICQGVMYWYQENTKYNYYIATVANNNEKAIKLVKDVDFSLLEKQRTGWLKDGIEHGQSFFMFCRDGYNIHMKDR